MDDRKEVLPLRRVAARFINMDEQTGLAELDRIAADASRVIQKRYWLLSTTSAATAFATAVTILPWIALILNEAPDACQSACKRDPLSARKRDPLTRWRKVDRTRAFALRAA